MNRSIFQLVLTHFREFIRDPEILFWSVLFPVATAWVLGVAFVEKSAVNRNVAIVGEAQKDTRILRWVNEIENRRISNPDKNDKSNFKFLFIKENDALTLMRKGRVNLYIQSEGRGSAVQFRFDTNNDDSYLTYLILQRRLSTEKVETVIQPVKTAGNRYIDYLIPGLLAMGIMNSCLWGIGYQLIEFRMKKLLRRMMATPVKKWQFLLSFFYARTCINLLEGVLLFLFAALYFDFKLQGNLVLASALYLSGNIAFGGLAMLVASRAENTRVGNGLVSAITMPLLVISGIFFSYSHFPEKVIPLLEKTPLALLADSFRSVFNSQMGITEVWPALIILPIFGVLSFLLALRLFRWH